MHIVSANNSIVLQKAPLSVCTTFKVVRPPLGL